MATAAPSQDFKNHQKFVPAFHYVALPLLLVNLIYSGYVTVTSFSLDSVMALLLAVAVMIVAFLARVFALGAQDRVIRLEERLRLHELLPPDQKHDIDKLTTGQLIALRFASDGEVAALVATVRAEGIEDRNEIKKRVTNWRADHQRL
ncbi:MAG: hypothetical protein IH921_07980 [Gemmatimonadetes bacterium]|nr:hypothetical protein [Gemmatimonadota bacterium]